MRLPGVLADDHDYFGVLKIWGGMTRLVSEQLAVNPELTGLLLSEAVRPPLHSEVVAPPGAVSTSKVISLTAPP